MNYNIITCTQNRYFWCNLVDSIFSLTRIKCFYVHSEKLLSLPQGARRLQSVTFRDISELSRIDKKRYPALASVPLPHLQMRFGVVFLMNRLFYNNVIHLCDRKNFEVSFFELYIFYCLAYKHGAF